MIHKCNILKSMSWKGLNMQINAAVFEERLSLLYINKVVEVFSFVRASRPNRTTYMDKWYHFRISLTCRCYTRIANFHIYHNGVTKDGNMSKIVKKCNYLGNYASNWNSEGILCSSTFNSSLRSSDDEVWTRVAILFTGPVRFDFPGGGTVRVQSEQTWSKFRLIGLKPGS